MNNIDKRLKKIETWLTKRFNHHGVFIVLIDKGCYKILNKEIEIQLFNSKNEMEKYIYDKYDCEKYVFITFDTSKI